MAIAVLIGLIVYKAPDSFIMSIMDTAFASALFAVTAMMIGLVADLLLGTKPENCFTLMIEFAVRNVAIATTIAVSVLGHIEFAVFATAYFLTQVQIIMAAIFIFFKFMQSARQMMTE